MEELVGYHSQGAVPVFSPVFSDSQSMLKLPAHRTSLGWLMEEKMKQALITNYMNNWDGKVRTLEEDAPRAWVTSNLQLVYDDEGPEIRAYLPYDGALEVASNEFYEDNQGGHWINHVDVHSVHHRRYGIATALYRAAIQEIGPIYASNAGPTGRKGDDRELVGEGYNFVQSLLNRRYMQHDWYKAPIA